MRYDRTTGIQQFVLWIVRSFALLLFFLCLGRIWSGFRIQQAEALLENGRSEEAVRLLRQAAPWDVFNPHWAEMMGRSFLEEAKRTNDRDQAYYSARYFETLTQKIPRYGRGWLYLGISLLEAARLRGTSLPKDEWEEVKSFLRKAKAFEPYSPWVAFMIGRALLMREPHLSEEERVYALEEIRESIRIHYPNPNYPFLARSSPFLEPSLTLLWHAYGDFQLLKSVTPVDRASYKALLDVMRREGLWTPFTPIYEQYLQLEEEAYDRECEKGDRLLLKGDYKGAFVSFRKAYWVRSAAYSRAKAGVLTAENALNRLEEEGDHHLFGKPYKDVLQDILEDEDEELGHLLLRLNYVVERSNSPYLAGLYAYRRREYERAKKLLKEAAVERPAGRRALAVSFFETGYKERAVEVIESSLQEKNPDLRELLLLYEWDEKRRAQIKELIEERASRSLNASAWWGKHEGRQNELKGNGRLTIGLNLYPGKATVRLFLKAQPQAEGSLDYVQFTINGRSLGGAYVDQVRWQQVVLEVETSGGKRWLSAQLLNGTSENGPVVILGPLKVSYPEGGASV